jgi:phosphatidylethanolamine-binding protein (PEBP) family uncharacterized protein
LPATAVAAFDTSIVWCHFLVCNIAPFTAAVGDGACIIANTQGVVTARGVIMSAVATATAFHSAAAAAH